MDAPGMKDGEFLVIRLCNTKRTLRIPDLSKVTRPGPEFKKPHGTTFKKELTQFAVEHARAVRRILQQTGERHKYADAATIAVANLTNDAYVFSGRAFH